MKAPRQSDETVGLGFALRAFAGLAAVLVGTAVLVAWMFPGTDAPGALPPRVPATASPGLQSSPRNDMRAFAAEEAKALATPAWIDRAHGVVRIPIADAMRDVAAHGIADWPK